MRSRLEWFLPASVTGNCVIFKPSGLSPVTGWRLVEAFRNAGLPPGVLQFLPGPGHEVGEYLVAHEKVDFIAFTGSKDVGLRIVSLASGSRPGQHNVKKVIAEMGGKNAIILDETSEPDQTVKGVLESALGYQGQRCSACSRVIVIAEIYEEFLSRLKAAMESIRIGFPDDPGTFMGPVIDEAAIKKIRSYIRRREKQCSALPRKRGERRRALSRAGDFQRGGPLFHHSAGRDIRAGAVGYQGEKY